MPTHIRLTTEEAAMLLNSINHMLFNGIEDTQRICKDIGNWPEIKNHPGLVEKRVAEQWEFHRVRHKTLVRLQKRIEREVPKAATYRFKTEAA